MMKKKLKRFNSLVKVGTKVKLSSEKDAIWGVVSRVHDRKLLIRVEGVERSLEPHQVFKFSNR